MLTRTQLKDLAIQAVLVNGAATVLEFPEHIAGRAVCAELGETVTWDGPRRAEIIAEFEKQAERTYRFYGYEPVGGYQHI